MAKTTKIRRARAKRGVKSAIRKIEPEVAQEILAEAVEKTAEKAEERKERVPGQVIDGVKTSWTRRDIEERFPIVELISEENVKVTWNGVVYQLLEGATHYVPSVIKASYLRHRGEMRRAGKSMGEGSGFIPIINLGAGALEPEE